MKKRFLLFVLFTFVLGFMLKTDVTAATQSANSARIIPRINESGFNVGDKRDFTVGDSFDYSYVKFTTNVNDKYITGKSDMKIIYSGNESNYFSAYCMDGNKKYPEYQYIATTMRGKDLIKIMTAFQILKECNNKSGCNLLDGIDDVTGYYVDMVSDPSESTITAFDNGEEITSSMTSIGFIPKANSRDVKLLNANDIASSLGKEIVDGKVSVSFKKSDFMINHYTASEMSDSIGYRKALYIIEHSYPSLSLKDSLVYAGVSYETLLSSLNNSEENVSNAVYATVQYAVWKVIGEYYELDGENKLYLGDTLVGNSELNKLYQFLIKDRDKYVDDTYKNELVLELPSKEAYKSESDAEYYGPYKVRSKMLVTDWNSITAKVTNPSEGVTLVDKDLKELPYSEVDGKKVYNVTNINNSDNEGYSEFYIRIDNKYKSTTQINIDLDGKGKVYNTDSNRGRLFYSESKLDQVVIVSAKIIDVNPHNEVKLEYNAKTGVEDYGTLLLAILGAFTVGYIVLRFKEEPVSSL